MYAEYILQESGLEKHDHNYQMGGRNINILHCVNEAAQIAEHTNNLKTPVKKLLQSRRTVIKWD